MAELIQREDSLNTGREKLNEAIKASNQAEQKSDQAVNTSNEAKSQSQLAENKADNVQEQFNQVVIEGDSSVEAAQARVDREGKTFGTLKERLDYSDKNVEQISINVMNFGAVGDGISDDGPAIREAYTYLKSLGGGELLFPKTNGYFSIKSSVEVDEVLCGIIHDSNNITFKATAQNVSIKADVNMDSIIYSPVRTDNLVIDKIFFDGNNLVDYCFNTAENVYTPYLDVINSWFFRSRVIAFNVKTFVATFTKCVFGHSDIGLHISGIPQNIATSVTLNSCYAINNQSIGFKGHQLRYTTFNSCAVDNMPNGIAYDVDGRGISLNSCGAEKVRQPFRTISFRGLSINSFFTLEAGSLDSGNPTEYLFEFLTGTDATISGIYVEGSSDRHYEYKLGLTQSNYGFENITVLDDSIYRSQAYFVPNYKFTRPIKFIRGDETTRDITVEIPIDGLIDYLDEISEMEINHNLIINLPEGSQPSIGRATDIRRFKGVGKLTIQGAGKNKTILHGAYNRLYVENSTLNIEFKNLTIENRTASSQSHIVQVDNANHVVLNNVALYNNERNTGSAVSAKNGSKVYITNGTSLEGSTSYWLETSQPTWYADETSEIIGV